MGERLKCVFRLTFAGGISALLWAPCGARPIVFADSTTVIAEYREDAISELQVFYAPAHNWSVGVGHFEVEADDLYTSHSMTYLRANLLAKRWNLESAQANIFVWGGFGGANMGKTIIEPGGDPSDDHGHGEPHPTTRCRCIDRHSTTSHGRRAVSSTMKPDAFMRPTSSISMIQTSSRIVPTRCNWVLRLTSTVSIRWLPG